MAGQGAATPVAQAGGAGGDAQEGQRQQGGIQNLFALVMRMGLMYAFMMYMRSGKNDTGPDIGAVSRTVAAVLQLSLSVHIGRS